MERHPLYRYIWFGSALRYLQDAQAGWLLRGEWYVAENLAEFLDGLKELGLTTTATVAFQHDLEQQLKEFEAADEGAVLTVEQRQRLIESMRAVRTTLDAEAQHIYTFVVSSKRWDVEKLQNEPSALFAPGTFSLLSELAQYDFQEAGRCIAFERSTAAAFHLMRGTEAVLRDFYCSVVKRNRLAESRRTWGAMLQQLRDRRNPPPAALLDNLDHIREHYRNPTQHPDAVYDIQLVQDLLGLCIPVVNEMAKEFA